MFSIFANGTIELSKRKVVILVFVFLIPYLNFFDLYALPFLFFCTILTTFFSKHKLLSFICSLYLGGSVIIFHSIILSDQVAYNLLHILFLLIVVASSDIGGYFFGKFIGGPKIWIAISPNKTWAGSLGGIAFAMLISVCLQPLLGFSLVEVVVIGVILALSAQVGDLFESWLKRKFKVKDSGFLLPGHGGFFDRFDGFLAAAPAYKVIVYLFY